MIIIIAQKIFYKSFFKRIKEFSLKVILEEILTFGVSVTTLISYFCLKNYSKLKNSITILKCT